MPLSPNDCQVCSVYGGTVSNTKVEVTDNVDVLLYGFHIQNTTAAVAYLQVFDKDADDVTVGTTVPDYVIGVAANNQCDIVFQKPKRHSTGFTIASCTSRTNNTGAAQEVTIQYVT